MTTTPASGPRYAVVIPTIGRPTLHRLLAGLAAQHACADHPRPVSVVVVDDRPHPFPGLLVAAHFPISVLRSAGRGPAAARNVGWRSVAAPWVVFLDDDVELTDEWSRLLCTDLAFAPPTIGGSQACLRVPLPTDRRPTDWERSTAGLAGASWITADMAYRRTALEAVNGFDERFPRAYREDADLALRVRRTGWGLQRGRRTTIHPVRPAGPWVSVRLQAGAADDALMRRLHGRHWRRHAQTGRGRLRVHLLTVTAAAAAAGSMAAGRRRPAVLAAAAWAGLTADFALRRITAGPGLHTPAGRAEARRMIATSVVIPFAAVWHRLRGIARFRSAGHWPPPVRAVLFDRDGTLVQDVPYNGDPERVVATADARSTVDRLRRHGLWLGVVTNQSGVARGLLTLDAVAAVNRRIDQILGPFDAWQVCPHGPDAGCLCRKPAPGLVLAAARELGVAGYECAVIGDIGADVQAAVAAGARPVLVPTPVTLPAEIDRAPVAVGSLSAAVDVILRCRSATAVGGGRWD